MSKLKFLVFCDQPNEFVMVFEDGSFFNSNLRSDEPYSVYGDTSTQPNDGDFTDPQWWLDIGWTSVYEL